MKNLIRLLSLLCITASVNANAISIDVVADNNTLNLGESVEIEVRISGLDGASALGVYDLNLNYDTNLFSFSNLIWGDKSKGNQLDLMGFGSLQDSSSGSGWLNLFELSFDDAPDLELFQASEFTLFSAVFTSIALGSGHFFITTPTLGDAYGNDLLINSPSSTQVRIAGIAVPEPSSLLLLLGLLAVIALRSKLMRSSK